MESSILGSVPHIPLSEWDILSAVSLTNCHGNLHQLVEQENNDSCSYNVTDDEVHHVLCGFIPRNLSEGDLLNGRTKRHCEGHH